MRPCHEALLSQQLTRAGAVQDSVYYAYFAPYTLDMHQALVAEMQALPGVRLRLLGRTLDGHDLDQLQIGAA